MFERIRQTLLQLKDHPPMSITIARSSTDGFTPADDVDRLQNTMLALLGEQFYPAVVARLQRDPDSSDQCNSINDAGNQDSVTVFQLDDCICLFDIRENPSLYSHYAIYPNSLLKRKLRDSDARQSWQTDRPQLLQK